MDRSEFLEALKKGGQIACEFRELDDLPGGWGDVVKLIPDIKELDIEELVRLFKNYRIELVNEKIAPPLSIDDVLDIAAFLLQQDRTVLRKKWVKSTLGKTVEKDKFIPIVEFLLKLPEIRNITYHSEIVYYSSRRRFIHLDPPWKALDIPYGSIGWRMGGGEGYMSDWHEFMGGLDSWEREQYFAYHTPPSEWQEWYQNTVKDYLEDSE